MNKGANLRINKIKITKRSNLPVSILNQQFLGLVSTLRAGGCPLTSSDLHIGISITHMIQTLFKTPTVPLYTAC